MGNSIIDIATPPDKLEALVEQARPELEAVDPTSFVRRVVTRPRVLVLSNILLDSWAALVDQLDQVLAPAHAEQHKAALMRLDTRAWVFYAADLAAREIHANTARKQRRALAKVVASHDRFLSKWANVLFGDDPEHAASLRDISRGTGRRDDAEDVLRLVALYRANWDQVKDLQKAVTEARLEQAVADATRQLDYLRNGVTNPARQLAEAAYSLWHADYNALMQLGRYLTWRDGDSLERFPGIRELPTASGGQVVAETQPPQEGVDPDPDAMAVS
jgi:hypothetical protein